jgi:hypothetical protein
MASEQIASFEKKVTTAILSMIRARREEPFVEETDRRGNSGVGMPSVKLREALFSDFQAVTELKQRWGLSLDTFENWERLWRHNPALQQMEFKPPIGWVLEAEGEIVGYLGNIALLYHYGGRTLTAVTSSGLVVEPAYRSVSLTLVAASYRQKSVDLYLTTTAIEETGRIARAFKSDPLPQADYETMLFWVLQPYPFSQALMKKLKTGPSVAYIGGVLTSLAVGASNIVHRRWPRGSSTSLEVKEIGVNQIGADFETLWRDKLKEAPRLLADRSPAALRWHFEMPGDEGKACVLCCRKAGKLVGYAVIRDEPPNLSNGLRRSIAADMLAKEDDPDVLRALWAAAYEHAKRAGSHIFEVLGFPENIRRVCSQWNPYVRKYPCCPFYYKAADPALHKTLSDGLVWYASPFDGDTTLWSFGTALQRTEA